MAMSLPMIVVLLASSPALAAPDSEQASPVSDSEPMDPLDALVVFRVEIEGSDEIAALLRAEIMAALRDAKVEPDLPEHAPLEVVVSPDHEGQGAYEVSYRHRGQPLATWSCSCSGDELRVRLAHDTVEVWNAVVAESAAEAHGSSPRATVEPSDPGIEIQPRRRDHGRWSWIAGIATTAVGTSLVVGTTALVLAAAAEGRDPNRVTLGLMGSGVAMVVGGVVLWSIGAHRRKRSGLTALPAVRNRGVMVTLGGRF